MTQSAANPNARKPTLTLLGKKPIALAERGALNFEVLVPGR
jgi:hypothetical protein